MQLVVSEKPYSFVPPRDSRFWPWVLGFYLPRYLNRSHGIESVECRGSEKLSQSLAAGHGIILAPNHCRPPDPMLLGVLSKKIRANLYCVASWHLFMNGGMQAWLINRAGAFSIYREGMDKAALDAAIDIVAQAKRPLVIFPEGVITRANDALNPLMDGLSLIARSAAKRRGKDGVKGAVVIHPIAIRYLFRGDIRTAADEVLTDIEKRLTWQPQRQLSLIDRLAKVGHALLGLKEVEYMGAQQTGPLAERLPRLIDHLLTPLETQWVGGRKDDDVVARAKRLRGAILPDLIKGDIDDQEREHRWRQLADLYLAQQLSFYKADYIASQPTAERVLETIERFEEDLTDTARIHRPIHAIIQVGDAIEVSAARERGQEGDPVTHRIEESLTTMLRESSALCTPLLSK